MTTERERQGRTSRPRGRAGRAAWASAILLAGIAIGSMVSGMAEETAASQVPLAHVIVGGRILDPEGLGPYAEKAGPPAQAAGINVIARAESQGDILVTEGSWPYEGFLVIETFNSMEEFEAFWASAEYQEAIELREGKVELDFVVALPGVAAE